MHSSPWELLDLVYDDQQLAQTGPWCAWVPLRCEYAQCVEHRFRHPVASYCHSLVASPTATRYQGTDGLHCFPALHGLGC